MPVTLQHARPSAWPLLGLRAPSRASWQPVSLQRRSLGAQQQWHPWQPSRGLAAAATAGGSAPAQPSSSPQAELCPLHACLLRYGITDLAAFSKPRHLALSQEAVDADVEPKLAALRAEGLSPAQLRKLMPQKGSSILPCSYQDTFAPNLELLRSIAALKKPGRQRKGQQRLTAAGQVLVGHPSVAAIYLSRDPTAVQQQLNWLEGSLGIGQAELAGCSQLLHSLTLSEAASQAVASLLLAKGVPAARVVKAFQAKPTLFCRDPMLLEANLGYLASALQIDSARALMLALKEPQLLIVNLEGRLPQLLEYLDGYMGEEGARRRLVLRAPSLGTCTKKRAASVVESLSALGYQQQQIQGCINKNPELLTRNLDSPEHRQKIEWIVTVSPWTLDDFLLINPTYFFVSTKRLASRLVWMRAAGLELPPTPGTLATYTNTDFMSLMSRRLQKRLASKDSSKPLPVLGVADWKLWEAEWLQTEEGQRWGFLPEK